MGFRTELDHARDAGYMESVYEDMEATIQQTREHAISVDHAIDLLEGGAFCLAVDGKLHHTGRYLLGILREASLRGTTLDELDADAICAAYQRHERT